MAVKLSVVIPVYNGAAFIGRAIESVLGQTRRPDEIIVVNDGSKDETASVLAAYAGRVTVVTIPNGGVSNARNTGIQHSSGDWIAFLDADDIWYPHKLATQLQAIEQYPEAGFTCCNYRHGPDGKQHAHFDQFAGKEGFATDAPLGDRSLELLVQWNIVGTCSNVMIRRDILDRVGLFDRGYRQSEDYDLWLRCATETAFLLTSEVLLEKKMHDSNLTNDFLETLLFHEEVLLNLPQRYPHARARIQAIPVIYRQSLAALRYDIGNLYFENGKKRKAFAYFYKGLVSDLSLTNMVRFTRFTGRKLLRLASLGLIKKPQHG